MTTSIKEKVFNGTLWSGTGKLFSMGANFITTLVLARALAPADYGLYFVALTTIIIVASVGTLGMDQVVVRFAAMHACVHDHIGERRVITRCLGIVIVGTAVTCMVFFWLGQAFFLHVLNMPALATYIIVLTTWLFFATLQRQLAETFRGLNDIRFATLFGGVRSSGIINASLVCLIMLTVWMGGKLTLFTALLVMLSASVVVVLVALLTLWGYSRKRKQVRGVGEVYVTPIVVRTALHEGWPLWVATLITVLNNMGNPWLASALDTSAHVAILGVAQRFVLLLIAPMVIVNAVLPPIISQLYASKQLRRMEEIVRSISGLLLIPTVGLLAILLLGGKPLLHLLFGAYYENAYPILMVLCVGQVINIFTGAWQVILPMTGGRHQMLSSSVIAVLVQLVLGGGLGYRYGVLGVAIGFCVSMIITNFIGVWLVRRRLGIWTYAALNWDTMRRVHSMIMARFMHLLHGKNHEMYGK